MESILFILAQAEVAPNTSNPIVMIVFMVLFIVFFYFVVIRPQNKRKKEMEKMLNELRKGDKVVTIGGVHGKVVSVRDDVVVLKIDDNAEITFDKNAIARVINPNSQNNNQKKLKKDKEDLLEQKEDSLNTKQEN